MRRGHFSRIVTGVTPHPTRAMIDSARVTLIAAPRARGSASDEHAGSGVSQAHQPPSSTERPLRAWQRRALARYLGAVPQDFLAVATPGAGKTAFACGWRPTAGRPGDRRGHRRDADRAPQDAVVARRGGAGIAIDPEFRNSTARPPRLPRGRRTYAQVAAHPPLHRARTEGRRTLVILDEIHHGGRREVLGRGGAGGVRPRRAPARADRDPVPLRRLPHPVHRLQARRRGGAAQPGRPLLRLRRGARRRRRAAGDVPRLLRQGELAHERGRGVHRAARRAADPRADGAGMAHGAGPRR